MAEKKKKSFKGVKDTNITYVLEKNIQKINKMTKANEIADFFGARICDFWNK